MAGRAALFVKPVAGAVTAALAGAHRRLSALEQGARVAGAIAPVIPCAVGAVLANVIARVSRRQPTPILPHIARVAPHHLERTLSRSVSLLSAPLQESSGLAVEQLLDLESSLQQMLTPRTGPDGVKSAPGLLAALGRPIPRDPAAQLSPFPAFVWLGESRARKASEIAAAFDSAREPARVNPYDHTEFAPVWQGLVEQASHGAMPVFVSLGNDPSHPTPTDAIAAATVASLVDRKNDFGSDFENPASYYQWLTARVNSYYRQLEPWLAKTEPAVAASAAQIKSALAPLSANPSPGTRIWAVDPRKMKDASDILTRYVRPEGAPEPSVQQLCDFADLAASLDRDLSTGIQTQWIKLMRNLGAERRKPVLKALAHAWVTLNLVHATDPNFPRVAPADAPGLDEVAVDPMSPADPPMHRQVPYDRAIALGEVVDHTLNGLGIAERRQFMDMLLSAVRRRTNDIQQRDEDVGYGVAGDPFDLRQAIQCPEALPHDSLQWLVGMDAYLEHGARDPKSAAMVSRQLELEQWILTRNRRYGEVSQQLDWPARLAMSGGIPGQPGKLGTVLDGNPLGVGEFYQKNGTEGSPVSPMRMGPGRADVLGQGDGVTRVSLVLKGGGGRGFSYLECLQQLQAAFAASKDGKFAIDEYVGTSAGALTAGLMAAGFDLEALRTVLRQMDFRKFYADYTWMQGGVDPRARGISRAGLFSTQEMYRTLYGILSRQLGVQGRPILFRDLPYRLKVCTTVLNTDLPEDSPLRRLIGPDGQLVLSGDTTPNFDVVAAMVASSSIPGFFDPPEMEVSNPNRFDLPYHLQMADGGTVNNFPVACATRAATGKTGLAVLPADYTGLSVLDFGPTDAQLAPVDSANRQHYARFAKPLIDTMNEARAQDGYQRFVVALNLATPQEQAQPFLQGTAPDATAQLLARARESGLAALDPRAGAAIVAHNLRQDHGGGMAAPLKLYLSLAGRENLLADHHFHPPAREADNISAVLEGSSAALVAAGACGTAKRFEQSAARP